MHTGSPPLGSIRLQIVIPTELKGLFDLDYNNSIIYYFNIYFSLFLTKDPLPLRVPMKLSTNAIEPLNPSAKRLYCLCMPKKNNLTFSNLGYQTSTFRLYNLNYNLDYIIYQLK
jgi:hypothetical protein